jgi:hypothetical protein
MADVFLQPVNFVDHGVAANPKPVDFGFDLVLLDKVVRNINPAGGDQHRAANCHAARNIEAVDSKGHAGTAIGVAKR